MMRFSMLIIVVTGLLITSCKRKITGTGEIVTDERKVDEFEMIDMRGTANIEIIKGDAYRVMISGHENLVGLIETSVKNGKLVVSTENEMNFVHSEIGIKITTPSVKEITLSGAGNMEINSFKQSNLKISMHGAGNVQFANSECDTVFATLSGAGNMYLNVTSYLQATVNGVGNITYVGDPVVRSKVSGIGKVSKK